MADPISSLNAALAGRYRIERPVGEGGMATVYLADDLRHGRKVALKVLRPDLAASIGPERFLQEVRITANLQHPHILALHDSGDADGFLFYVMPYIEGESLKDRLAREGELPVADTARILRDVVDALAAAHAAGVVHRDIKPANIMLSGRHAIVADFGVAKALSEAKVEAELTTVGTSLGTPAYMSPEQAAADEAIDHRADIYAVGALAYEMLTGRPPFRGSSHRQVLMAHITKTPDPLTDHRASVPPDLAAAVMRCLQKKRADRWQRVEDLLPYLESAMASSQGTTPVGMAPVRAKTGRRAWLTVGIPLAAALAGLVGYGLWADGDAPGGTGTGAPDPSNGVDGAVAEEAAEVRLSLLLPRNEADDPNLAYVAEELRGEMRRALGRHAPSVRVSLAPGSDAVPDGRVTHTIASSFSAPGGVLTIDLDVARSDGEHLKTLPPVSGSTDSIPEVLARAADQAAVVGVYLGAPPGENMLRYRTLAPTAQVAALHMDVNRAMRSGRWSESERLSRRVLDLAPDFPGVYLSLFYTLPLVGGEDEWPALEARVRAMLDDMTRAEQLEWRVHFASSLEQAVTDQQELVDLTGDARNWANLAFHAVHANQLSVAAEAFDHLDFEGRQRNMQFTWKMRADVYHVRGEFQRELDWTRLALGRFGETPWGVELEVRALIGLDSVALALDRTRALHRLPLEPHGLLHRLENTALEFRRHGHPEASQEVLGQMLALIQEHPDLDPEGTGDDIDVGHAYYLNGDYDAAIPWFEKGLRNPGTELRSVALLALSLEAVGRGGEIGDLEQRLLERLASPPPQGGQAERMYWNGARRFASLLPASRGDATETIRRLNAAFARAAVYHQSGDWSSMAGAFLHLRPEFEAVRDDPRFQAVVAPR